MAYPVSPIAGRRSNWRSFAASLNLEDGPASSDSTSSPSEQTSDGGEVYGDPSENLNSRKLKSDEVSYHPIVYCFTHAVFFLCQDGGRTRRPKFIRF